MKYTLSMQSVFLIMMCNLSKCIPPKLLTFFLIVRKYRWSLPENDIHKNGFVASGVMVVAPKSMDIFIEEQYY